MNERISRRRFIGGLVAVGTGVAAGARRPDAAAGAPGRTATDLVPLGGVGVKVSRLGLGTGSRGGRVQRELGQQAFTKLVRHAIDRGITFIDTADNYDGLHEMVHEAIRGVDRTRLQIQCKISATKYPEPLKEIDRFRREVGTEYFDSFLIHCVRTPDWPAEHRRLMDQLDSMRARGIIRAAGVSIHGLPPLRAAAAAGAWGDVRLVRVNHNGQSMDNLTGDAKRPGDVSEVVRHVRTMHAAGKGIIGMKLAGNGDFTDATVRRAAIEFVVGLGCVDAMVIGFKAPAEVDEAIENVNRALARSA